MISVVIPLYNVEKYIIDCLKSFENQVYKDFELLIINDGSTDNSASIVKRYIKSTKMNIQLINQENAGVCAARNKGINEAKGKYICFIDSDDMLEPNYLINMLNILEVKKCDVVICGMKNIPEYYKFNEQLFRNSDYLKSDIVIINSNSALKKLLYGEIVSGVGSMVINRDIIERFHLRYKEGFRYSEDQELIWRIISKSNSVAIINDQYYLYRIRSNSAMSVINHTRMDGFKLMLNLEKYFQEENFEFSKKFDKFGVARWVWATTWQLAIGSKNFNEFYKLSNEFHANTYMKKLITYPKIKVKISSFVFIVTPRLYYLFVKYLIGLSRKTRKINK